MIELFESAISGNSHKVRMMLSFLNLKYESRIVNMKERGHKTEEFLEKNPFGQVPVLKDGDVVIRDSQAILVYLARAYGDDHWFPMDAAKAAEVTAWLSTAANEVARGPSALRAHFVIGKAINVEEAQAITDNLLPVLEKRLRDNLWLATASVTVADIAVYPYIALAHQGKVDLGGFPRVRAWLHRIESLPGYVGMAGIPLQAPGNT